MRKIIYKLGLFIFFSFLLIINSSLLIKSQAHPQPLVVQEFLFEYSQKSIVLTYHMRIDPIVMDQVYTDIDKDKDGKITVDETKTFLNDILFKNLTARLNNRDLVFEYDSSLLPKSSDLKSLDNYIGIRLVAKDPKILETNSIYVKYNKKYIPNDAYGDYYNYEDNIIDQNQIERINIDQTEPAGLEEYSTDFKFKDFTATDTPTTEPKTAAGNPTQSTNGVFDDIRQFSTKLTEDARAYDFSNPFTFILAAIVLFFAGALHALTPGHGKSMVAAFLIGKKKSKFIDVLILGLSITIAHTAVIYIIGFTLLALNKTSQANQITSIIEKISAWLFLALGLYLFYKGYKIYQHFRAHQLEHEHHHSHDHNHSDATSTRQLDNTTTHQHSDHGHSHEIKDIKIRNRWDLFYAGISGGIVPCIDALSILFLFTSMGKVELGIFLVFIFSLGLAAMIILLGVSLLYGKDKLKLEEKIGEKAEFIMPIISGGIISLIGIFYILTK